mgnify:FL=1
MNKISRRSFLKAAAVLGGTAALTACGGSDSDKGSAAADGSSDEKAVLRISLSLGQWADHVDSLTEAAVKEIPGLEDIEWELVSSSTYWDLMKGKLASDELPDIMAVQPGLTLDQWHEHLVPMDDVEGIDSIPEEFLESCRLDGKLYLMPFMQEGYGLLYNMRLLKEAGWETTPTTFDELQQLCEDLKAANIQPFVNHYKENILTLSNHYGMLPGMLKDDPFGYVNDLIAGKDMDIPNDPDWNAMIDFYDLSMKYGNADALTVDKQTGRNDFFTEKAAIITDEGSWELTNIRNINPDMEEYVQQTYVPLFNDSSRNKMSIDLTTAAVTEGSEHPDLAKKFMVWLATSESALNWLMGEMGVLPVSANAEVTPENVGCLSAQTAEMINTGHGATSLQYYTPEIVRPQIGEWMSKYLAGEIDRTQTLEGIAKAWSDYAANN